MERKFMANLNERDDSRSGKNNNLVGDLHLAYIEVGSNCPFVGDKIAHSGLRRDYGVSISSIQRGLSVLPLPVKDTRIFPGDILGIIGTDEAIKHLNDDIESYAKAADDLTHPQPTPVLMNIRLSASSPLIGKRLDNAELRQKYFSMLVKITRGEGEASELELHPKLEFLEGDRLWLVGDADSIKKLK
jgi:CPA2 family monovalent cation:H+ antiporter-2